MAGVDLGKNKDRIIATRHKVKKLKFLESPQV